MNSYLKFLEVRLLGVTSFSAEDEVAVADMSEEQFDAEFDKMMNEPSVEEDTTTSEEDSIETEVKDEAEETEAKEETEETEEEDEDDTEQPEDDEVETEQETDEKIAEDETEDETEDSASKEAEKESKGFDFNSMPMDELLPMEIAANGSKVKATMNELVEGFKKGMNYTQKLQELAPLRRSLSIVSSNDISEEDLNLLVEAKGGNKEAISKLLSKGGIDPLDVDVDENKDYVPKDYGKDEVDVDMDMVRKEIQSDTEYAEDVKTAINDMPEDMYTTVSSSAKNLSALHKDVQSGIYKQVMPEVKKLQMLYGNTEPTMDTYLKVANTLFESKKAKAPDQAPAKKEVDTEKQKERNDKRKRASSGTKSTKKESFIKDDIKSLGEEDFEAQFAKVMGRSINDYK